jgi:hypothetical protein
MSERAPLTPLARPEFASAASPGAPGAGADAPRPRSASLLRYSPGLVLVAITIADFVRSADPDLWGHLAFGRWMLAHHQVLAHDIYSYTATGWVVHDHEWLAEVILAAFYNALGTFGLKTLKLLCVAATMLTVAMTEAETGAPELAQLVVLLVLAMQLAPYLQFRPQLFTFALFTAFILILSRDCLRRTGRVWLTIPLLMLWANLHGGFIMGVAAIAVYAAVAGAQDVAAGRGWNRAIALSGIALAATLATLVNPFGIGMWQAVAHALRDPYTRKVIDDWQPTVPLMIVSLRKNPALAVHLLAALLMIASAAVAWCLSRDLDDLPIVAIGAVMSAAAIVSQRNVPLAEIALAGPLLRHGRIAFLRRRGLPIAPAPPVRRAPPLNQVILAAIAIGLLLAGKFFSNRLPADERFPAGAVSFMEQHHLHGNILCRFGWGEYVIWHLAPESRVFIDGRYDTLYPMDVVRAFLRFNFDAPGGAKVLDGWPNDFVMIKPSSKAAALMRAQRGWKLIYRDDSTLLYARSSSAAARIAGEPFDGVNPPAMFP